MYDDIKEIRFLPLDSKQEFPELVDVLLYLLKELPIDQKGRFYYRSHPIIFKGKTLVLFQYKGELIAYGYMIDIDEYDEKTKSFINKKGNEEIVNYPGCYIFDPKSIKILSRGITATEWEEHIEKTFKGFGQGEHKIDRIKREKVMDLIYKHIE